MRMTQFTEFMPMVASTILGKEILADQKDDWLPPSYQAKEVDDYPLVTRPKR